VTIVAAPSATTTPFRAARHVRARTCFSDQSTLSGQLVVAGTGLPQDGNTVNQAVTNVSKLPHVLSATSPFANPRAPVLSKDGAIAYGTVDEHAWWLPRWLRWLPHLDLEGSDVPVRSPGQVEAHPRRVMTDVRGQAHRGKQDDSGKGFRDDDRTRTAARSGL
jgi:hypothetical protein